MGADARTARPSVRRPRRGPSTSCDDQSGISEARGGPALAAIGITKRFPGVIANDGIDFIARHGEVHAILGENGAGKSTLCNILSGLYRQDAGEIEVYGRRVEFHSPRDALDAGVGMVHQHFRLVPSFTVAQNVVLGGEETGPLFSLSPKAVEARVAELADTLELPIDPRARIWQLSVGEQQRVEILKALYRQARILILDEPTAVLAPQEADALFDILRRMVDADHTVVLITHKLDEVIAASDRVTVLRDGRVVGSVNTGETDSRTLARMMVGRDLTMRERNDTERVIGTEPVLEVTDISAVGDRGNAALSSVTFQVRRGEVLGLAGVAGNGQKELAEVIAGLRKPSEGLMTLRGAAFIAHSPRAAIQRSLAYVPDDRLGTGLAPNAAIAENLVLKSFRKRPFSSGPFINHGRIFEHGRELMERYSVKASGPMEPVRLLSGGNIQKVLLARELAGNPVALVAVSPTRGLDIGATDTVRSLLLDIANAGVAILLISEDLDEILTLSDRIGVLYGGRLVGMMPADEADPDELGLLMAGATG